MKILTINLGNSGSTGSIIKSVSKKAEELGHFVVNAFPSIDKKSDTHTIIIGNKWSKKIHKGLGYYLGLNGMGSVFSTLALVRKIKKIKPDLIHLHNLHGYYINLWILFGYIKRHKIKTVWTLHDCWAFTGHCSHFEDAGCEKWKTCCNHCPIKLHYPRCYIDDSSWQYVYKKKCFLGVRDLTIVTPSLWLENLVKQSFLKCYPVKTIHNGIDLDTFKYTENDFKKKHNCENKILLLGVASPWSYYKGLDVFLDIYKTLDGSKYQIVLVGTNDSVDKELPKGIISIHRTENVKELIEVYSAADLFINPTREETFCLTTLEALACGTPVIAFNTGGCPEQISDNCGFVAEKNSESVINAIISMTPEMIDNMRGNCIEKAQSLNLDDMVNAYCKLYNEIVNKKECSDEKQK